MLIGGTASLYPSEKPVVIYYESFLRTHLVRKTTLTSKISQNTQIKTATNIDDLEHGRL